MPTTNPHPNPHFTVDPGSIIHAQPRNFLNDRHALYVGWVIGSAVREGIYVKPVLDVDGNYTNTIGILLDLEYIDVVIPPPPPEWTLLK